MRIRHTVIRFFATAAAVAVCASCLFSCALGGSTVKGDCNGDGKVNAVDSNLMGRLVLGESVIVSPEGADMNSDELRNDADRTLLRRYISRDYLPGHRFESIYINGRDISEFTVVIPKDHTDFEEWTADILADTVEALSGIKLEVRTDNEGTRDAEILIGETDREQSKVASPSDGHYLIFSSGEKIVIKGENYYVGAGAGHMISVLENSYSDWNSEENIEISTELVSRTVEWETPENVFFFIGDGMGLNHTRMATDQSAAVEYAGGIIAAPDEIGCEIFWPSTYEHIGEAVTLNIQESTTDSAAGATTLATGYKTLNGALGMIPADLDGDGEEDEFASVQNVREIATMRSKATAVISTDKQTGATPNAFLIHHYTRKDRSIILEQQKALENTRLACNYLWCSYDSDDVLSKLMEAVDICDDNPDGFFIMTEEAMIDKYGEKMDYDNVIRTVKRLNKMTAYAATYAMCHRDTLIVITADHETGGLILGEDNVWRWTSDGEHTSSNVPVFAMGYGTEFFHATARDNTEVAKFIIDAIMQ